jgi:hypothetical protein
VGIEPKEFVRDPLRDAKASIRGYVYQVDVSILRWLTLGEGEILELECGEDIDIIQDEIAKGRSRILEQIKVSGTKLTLNSPGPKASLVNFRKHLLANPTQRLAFRYVTTAEITAERPSRFSDGAAGIVVWQELRNQSIPGDILAVRLSGIRQILGTAVKPPDIREADWNEFTQFLRESSDLKLLRFVFCGRPYILNLPRPNICRLWAGGI